jgi:hypothetical protein
MARTHVVLEGETLESIAAAQGFHDFRKLYDSPENAALRLKRPHPALVAPGDEVVIPDLVPFKFSVGPSETIVIERLPRIPLPPFQPTLDVSTLVSTDEDLKLLVQDGSGNVVQTLEKESGSIVDDVIHFTLDPATLPDPVVFALDRAGEIETFNPLAAPADALDDLENDRLAEAATRIGTDATETDDRVAGDAAAGGSTSGKPGPAIADVRVVVSFKNPGHRLLKLLQVNLTNAAEVPGTRGPGRFVFDALAGSTDMSLDLKIPRLAGSTDILNFSQGLTILRSGSSVTVKLTNGQHPRVRSLNMSGTKKAVASIELDFTFLDVTGQVRATSPSFNRFLQLPINGCRVVVLEHTAVAKGPPRLPAANPNDEAFVWAVVIPPKVQQSSATDINLLIHFQHELKLRATDLEAFEDAQKIDGPYVNSDEVPYDRLSKYLAPGPTKRPGVADNPAVANFTFQDSTGTVVRDPNESFHWSKQLVDSDKPVVLCLPFPKIEDVGPVGSSLGAEKLLASLLTALQAEKTLAPASPKLKLRRIALSGWSSGTQPLARWCKETVSLGSKLGDLVREVYFFDGRNSTRPALAQGGDVELWFDAGKGNRMLRMIGTANTEAESVALAARKGVTEAIDRVFDAGGTPSTTPIRALPGRLDYFYDSPVYKAALSHPSVVDMSLATRAQGLNPTPTNVTDVTTIFKDKVAITGGFAKAFVQITFGSGAQNRNATLLGFSEVETASELFFIVTVPPATPADFDAIVRQLNFSGDTTEPNRVLKARHPWAPRGGALRRGSFVGYLQFCLEESGF